MNESWHTYEASWIKATAVTPANTYDAPKYECINIWMHQHMNASTYECINIWIHHGTHLWIRPPHAMNAPCYAYVISRIRMRHVTHTNESWPVVHTIFFHECMCHVTHTNVCAMSRIQLLRDLTHAYDRHDSFICKTHACDMTHSCVGRDSHTHIRTHTSAVRDVLENSEYVLQQWWVKWLIHMWERNP